MVSFVGGFASDGVDMVWVCQGFGEERSNVSPSLLFVVDVNFSVRITVVAGVSSAGNGRRCDKLSRVRVL